MSLYTTYIVIQIAANACNNVKREPSESPTNQQLCIKTIIKTTTNTTGHRKKTFCFNVLAASSFYFHFENCL